MVDLHIHFPMRLLGGVEAPADVVRKMVRVRARDDGKLRAAVLAIAARLFNFRDWDGTWRVDVPKLERGEVKVACSVLYRPFSELDLDEPYGAPPQSAYYDRLIELMDATEREVEASGHIVVRSAADLERDGKIAFVHCIEGGFHLGATPEEVTRHVRELAARGVAYITLAHLFWRQVAANTPALPFLPDPLYNLLFPQKDAPGLSPLGEAAVRAMYASGVLVDVSHMREDAIDATFKLVEALDRETGADPRDYPVIVSHAGYRFGSQQYNVSGATIARIAARGGVIGLIFAQHQINDGLRKRDTKTLSESLDVLSRHIDAIGPAHVGLGSDLDGFIKPTLGGVETAADLKPLADGLRARYPESAEAMLNENALRVIRRRFASTAP
jgi:microsomal dipeptidase-like Zn-dependent dipeptidase